MGVWRAAETCLGNGAAHDERRATTSMSNDKLTHLRVTKVAQRLGHSRRWVLARIADGSLEGFKHSRRDVTVSLESILAYEQRTRMRPDASAEPVELAG